MSASRQTDKPRPKKKNKSAAPGNSQTRQGKSFRDADHSMVSRNMAAERELNERKRAEPVEIEWTNTMATPMRLTGVARGLGGGWPGGCISPTPTCVSYVHMYTHEAAYDRV